MNALYLTSKALETIRATSRAGRPLEVCGILVGRADPAGPNVVRVVEASNVWSADAERTHRFLLDPLQQMRVEREAEADGLAVVGFYHTHPDAPAVPSAFDLDAAWAVYSYVIVSVRMDGACDVRSWVLEESPTRRFIEQQVIEVAQS